MSMYATQKFIYGAETPRATAFSGGMDSAAQAEANWKQAQNLFQRPGPYTPEVVNQLTNRRADQTAAAEAVNAEEIRNQAAARNMDPAQAIRSLQQDRQRGNIAFSGDMASRAAEANFAAESPGRLAAAQAYLQRQLTGGTQPAVTNRVGGGGGGGGGGSDFGSRSWTPQMGQAPSTGSSVIAGSGKPAAKPMDLTDKQTMSPIGDRFPQGASGVGATSAANTIYDPAGGSGWVQNDRTERKITISPQKPITDMRQRDTAFSGAPTITPQQQAQIDSAAVKAAPPINTKTNPFANYGQPTKGSRTLPMTTNPLRLF
jgi:hypothetical protein